MKKRALLPAFILILLGAMGSFPALADTTLYDNTGSTSYGYNDNGAFYINYGWEVSDSFTLASNSTLTGVNMIAWLAPGDTMTQLDWLITDTAFGSNTYASGTASVIDTYLGTDPHGWGWDLDQESFSLPDLSLAAGTYYLQLQNAVTMDGGPAGWDDSDGPSDAVQAQPESSYLSDLNGMNDNFGTNSETFQILGQTENPTPEPSSFLLLASGLAGLAGVLKRKLAA